MDLEIAWGVVVLAGLGALAGVFRLTRGIGHPSLRWGIRSLIAVWLLVPWPIGVVPGHSAPAFLVAIFEGLFRAEGQARPPLVVLGLASAAVTLVFLLHALVRRLRRPAAQSSDAAT